MPDRSIGTRMPCERWWMSQSQDQFTPYRARATTARTAGALIGGAHEYHHNSGHRSDCFSGRRRRLLRPWTLVLGPVWIISTTAFWRLAGFLLYLSRLFLWSFWPASSLPEPRQSVSHPWRLSGAFKSFGLVVLPPDRNPYPRARVFRQRRGPFRFILEQT